MEDRLLGPRAGEKIRDMLIKQNPGTAIQQIKDRHGLNHNNLNNTNRTFSCFYHTMHACWVLFPALLHASTGRWLFECFLPLN